LLWNGQYMNDAIDHLTAGGHHIPEDDLRRLSPLAHEHIKLLGDFPFSSPCPISSATDNGDPYASWATRLSVRSCSITTGGPSSGVRCIVFLSARQPFTGSEVPLWWPSAKIVGPYFTGYIAGGRAA
jgi:hypothetical protein